MAGGFHIARKPLRVSVAIIDISGKRGGQLRRAAAEGKAIGRGAAPKSLGDGSHARAHVANSHFPQGGVEGEENGVREILRHFGRGRLAAVELAQSKRRVQSECLETALQTVFDAILREKHGIADRRHGLATKPVDQVPIGRPPEEPENYVVSIGRLPPCPTPGERRTLLFTDAKARALACA